MNSDFVAVSEKFMISSLNPLTKKSNPYHNIQSDNLGSGL